MEVQDRIERTMTFEVPRDDVWAAITDPELISKWFPHEAEFELRAGADGVFRWGETEVGFTIETVEPKSLFAYRWRPSKSDSATTLVEFRLEEIPGGTRLHLVESGFAALLPESRQDNEFGWDDELGQLREFLASRVSA
jgi:uncharacterized protein YndB with AHSA1/START domain